MTYCTKCGKPTNNGIVCEDCIISGSPWLSAMKRNEKDLEEEVAKLKAENAALRERLEKAVELPFVPTDYHIETWLAEIKVSLTDESATIVVPVYIYQKFDNIKAAFVRLAELKGEKK